MIRFFCASCSAPLGVADQDAGTIGWCPHCRDPYMVPRASQPLGTIQRRPFSPPQPLSLPKPVLIVSSLIAISLLLGFLYAIVDSTRRKPILEPRAEQTDRSA